MKTSQIVDMMLAENNSTFKFVEVQFANSTAKYVYKTLEDVNIDDTIVVLARGKLQCVTVVGILEADEYDIAANRGFDIQWVESLVNSKTAEHSRKQEEAAKEYVAKTNRAHKRKEALKAFAEGTSGKAMDALKNITKL